MTKLNDEQIAAGAAAIRAAEPQHSPEELVQAVFDAVSDAKTGGSHKKRVDDLDKDIEAENEKAADAEAKADAERKADIEAKAQAYHANKTKKAN